MPRATSELLVASTPLIDFLDGSDYFPTWVPSLAPSSALLPRRRVSLPRGQTSPDEHHAALRIRAVVLRRHSGRRRVHLDPPDVLGPNLEIDLPVDGSRSEGVDV